jgi:NADH-quinone oxidoreductase subunit K
VVGAFPKFQKTNPQQLPFSSSKPYFCSTFFDMPAQYYLFLSLALFCIGVMGVLMRRNAIIILMCIELMLNAVNLLMVTFSKMHNNADAQLFVFFIMVVAAAEVSIGLSIIVLMYRKIHSIDVNILNRLKN